MLPALDRLRSFECAARTLNFTAAGHELGLTQAAVSQHIKLLEAELGRPLFRRLPRGVELTLDGAAYLPHVQAAFGSLGRSTQALFGPDRRATLTLCGPISFMALWLAPRLVRLQAALPRIRLTLTTMSVPADYEASATDFDLRFGTGSFPGRSSHRLTMERLLPMAAPRLIERIGPSGDWTTLPLLSVTGAREMWPDWFAAARLSPARETVLRCDSFIIAYEAARHGSGVLLGAQALASASLADGSLIALSTIALSHQAGHFVTYAAGRSLGRAENELLDWLLHEATEPHPQSTG
ncbi:LysR family transcriptional regulator [Lichenifustis flavocetrariae]|uniref:LysR family transcriptional regulator n=1 Tax=Lichenifustis flavocetrariae TaxID=2949735 RepID=A0AA41YUW4_9HYPH|nr:LysR family transcriptional regulator [Lichenifustis flavocetrariae]MCW6508574.1 LysR family transcriptional regulator [Lichenifustis flavocetrariae]